MNNQSYDIFISYSRKDTAVAERICSALDANGITYFIDRQGIDGGMEFPEILADAICNCKIFLYLASSNSYESKFTNSEITFAFNEKPKQSILPYIIDGSDMPRSMRFIFSGINWRNMTEHPIETVLIADLLKLLNRSKPENLSEFERTKLKAERGDAVAQCKLGECYLFGKEVTKDYDEAVKWHRRAAEQGYAESQYRTGMFYDRDKDYINAIKWYRKAADGWNGPAARSIGYCYFQGHGVPQNIEEAKKWYQRAIDYGDTQAKDILRRLEKQS